MNTPSMSNLFAGIPADLTAECFDLLAAAPAVRIERIVSRGQATPDGEWYEEESNEWVLLVQGAARLVFGDGHEWALGPGDWIDIPAHQKHRVTWTDPEQDTIWLAVHYR
ncbi:MAG: cupin domain-containing protein [Rhodocyclaceae bacterium]|nr:cupin domain-containing protein [Rhodocyclaceae bacterium]